MIRADKVDRVAMAVTGAVIYGVLFWVFSKYVFHATPTFFAIGIAYGLGLWAGARR